VGRRHRDLKPGAQAVGRPAAYGWNGAAWHVMAMPRVFLTRPPWLAVAASGEAWLVGAGTKRVHRQSIILYRMGGTWKRLADRVLGSPPVIGAPCRPPGFLALTWHYRIPTHYHRLPRRRSRTRTRWSLLNLAQQPRFPMKRSVL
jgi:hypothetical protein